jgi:long-chain acyl-CoA synthetase
VNLAALLLAPAESTPDAVALVAGDTTVTYRELADRAAAFSAHLVAQGIEPGARVALDGHNTVDFVVAYLGALRAGVVVVPLNPHAPPAERERELELVGPVAEISTGDVPVNAPAVAAVERADEDVAVLLFTAGTAGLPRAAQLTHGNLAANLRQVQDHPGLALRADDVAIGVLPVFHVFGLNVGLGLVLTAGARIVLVEHFDPAPALAEIARHGVTIVAGAPTMYASWLDLSPDAAPPDALASARLVVSGAAPLTAEIANGMRERFGVTVHDGYGLTEASPIVTTSVIGVDNPGPGSIGPPLPGVEVRLVDVDGTDVLPGDSGELWVRGPNVFTGYWNDEEATRRVLTPDGWLRTGDVAVLDDTGALTLVDRTKDLIIVSGFNVYPAEVEGVLLEHPDIADAAVVGEPAPRTGETVIAYVVAEPGHELSTDDVAAHCARLLARYKCPSRIEVVGALPRSFVGKILRRELRPG